MKGGKKIICPTCQKKFASTDALAAHKRDAHGGASAKKQKARRSNRVQRSVGGMQAVTSSGKDYLATFPVMPNAAPGTRAFYRTVSPCMFEGTRLCQEAGLWARWRPSRLALHVTCAGASTTFGSVSVGWDPDSTNNWLGKGGEDQVRRILALPVSKTFRLSESGTLNLPVEVSRKWYQTTGELDQRSHGSLIAAITGTTGGYTGTVSITASLSWTVVWEGEAPPPIISTTTASIYPDAGWVNLFTTSDGSFDAEVLTFKMHAGGDMAPWSSARHGIVYTTEGTKTSVPYIDGAGVKQACKYFALVDGYSAPGLLCFGSQDDAKAYIRTADVSKALKYYKSGDYVTPASPELRPVAAAGYTTAPQDRIRDLEDRLQMLMDAFPSRNVVLEANSGLVVSGITKTVNQIKSQSRGTPSDPTYTIGVHDQASSSDETIRRRSPSDVSDFSDLGTSK